MPVLPNITRGPTFMEALRDLQNQNELSFTTFSDDWVITYWRGAAVRHIIGYAFDGNSQASAELATDKVAAYLLMQEAKLPVVEHLLLTTPGASVPDTSLLAGLFVRHNQLVLRPTRGRHGEYVTRCADIASAQTLLQLDTIPSWSASPYLELDHELRLVVFDGAVKLAYKKVNPPLVNGLKMFNLSLGATPIRLDPATLDPSMQALAVHAMDAVGLRLGAVDVVADAHGAYHVLELNAGFSIEHFGPHTRQSPRSRSIIRRRARAVIARCIGGARPYGSSAVF